MDNGKEMEIRLEYNTDRRQLKLPEYGRNVKKMVDYLDTIADREKRTEQARAIVKVMELLNPQVHLQDDYEHKLWDHLYILADFNLDVDSPFPAPSPEELYTKPEPLEPAQSNFKARHYGKNIESMLDLIASQEEGPVKDTLIRNIALYMRQQYLAWNKDSVSDDLIFRDIERLSEGRVKVPEGMELGKVTVDNSFPRSNASSGKKRQRNRKR